APTAHPARANVDQEGAGQRPSNTNAAGTGAAGAAVGVPGSLTNAAGEGAAGAAADAVRPPTATTARETGISKVTPGALNATKGSASSAAKVAANKRCRKDARARLADPARINPSASKIVALPRIASSTRSPRASAISLIVDVMTASCLCVPVR